MPSLSLISIPSLSSDPSHSAFLAGTASHLLPLSEYTYLRTHLPKHRLTPDILSAFLNSLNISTHSFSTALFTLSTPILPPSPSDFLTLYSTLRRLAYTPTPQSISAALWLCFRAASQGAEKCSFAQWGAFAETIGLAVGGVDSWPCEETVGMVRRRWKKWKWRGRGYKLSFQCFLKVMMIDHAGFVECLKAVAFVVTCAVIDAAGSIVEKPEWTGETESSFLSGFLTFAIGRELEGRTVKSRAVAGGEDAGMVFGQGEFKKRDMGDSEEIDMTESGIATGREGDWGGDWGEELENLVEDVASFGSIGVGEARGEHGRIAALEIRKKRSADRIPVDGGGKEIIEKEGGAQRAVGLLRRRKQGNSGGDSPFYIDFESLELGDRIGSGAYGDVFRGTFLMSPVAVKVFHVYTSARVSQGTDLWESDVGEDDDPSHMSRQMSMTALQKFASAASQAKYENFVREVEMMSVVRHPNLVLYMGACGDPMTPLCIVSELFTGGSLYEYLHQEAGFQPDVGTALSISVNIARGMFYLHASDPSILHRDLKSRNVLLSGKKGLDGVPHVVICDFGLCRLFGEEEGKAGGAMGTASYMAPGIIEGERYKSKDDVYSYGVLLHEIFTGSVPFAGQRPMQVMFGVASQGRRPTSERDEEIPESVRRLMRDCWDKDREKRPSFDGIIGRLNAIQQEIVGEDVLKVGAGRLAKCLDTNNDKHVHKVQKDEGTLVDKSMLKRV